MSKGPKQEGSVTTCPAWHPFSPAFLVLQPALTLWARIVTSYSVCDLSDPSLSFLEVPGAPFEHREGRTSSIAISKHKSQHNSGGASGRPPFATPSLSFIFIIPPQSPVLSQGWTFQREGTVLWT